ncbi:3-keto-5-aminohexanoate cleavage protein [Streptomyces sp. A1136]|uniref:3-keto-5-aminohexanoate cleavage protein n=1 Tax=Streptomyces sp. A1136 TaxID=2563102 RepID=UPI001F0F096D|nr:3-keto-5-aminohexanoate cleavage protein [Streptomyces sp. A1136]
MSGTGKERGGTGKQRGGAGRVAARLQVALNGARGAGEGASVPMSPRALAESALGAVAAGAREVLVHPRTPCGRESLSPRVVGPTLEALRGAGVSVPLSVPVSVAAEPDPAGRPARVRSWAVLPERAVVRWAEPGARALASALLERGVAVDAVVPLGGPRQVPGGAGAGAADWADAGGWAGAAAWADVGAWAAGYAGRVRLVGELVEADPALVEGLRGPPGVSWLLFGRDGAAWPALRLAARCGAGARIGVGDVLLLPDGRPARSNAELVAAAGREWARAATATAGSR